MNKCFITGCKIDKALYTVKIKKSEEDDKVYKVCKEHRDELDKTCKKEGWEFLEIGA